MWRLRGFVLWVKVGYDCAGPDVPSLIRDRSACELPRNAGEFLLCGSLPWLSNLIMPRAEVSSSPSTASGW